MISSQFHCYQGPKILLNFHLNVPGNCLDCISEHVIPSSFWGPKAVLRPLTESQVPLRDSMSLGDFWSPPAILLSPPTLFQMENPWYRSVLVPILLTTCVRSPTFCLTHLTTFKIITGEGGGGGGGGGVK